jgi:hypothetical protein
MQSLRRFLHYASWDTIASLPRAKLLALLVMIVVPGGFLAPVCYTAYVMIRKKG